MPMELFMLALSTVWLFVLIVVMALISRSQRSTAELLGPRDNLSEPAGLFARAKRTVDNHREGLILFAPFALIVVMQDATTSWTAIGAQMFFYSRVAHGITYVAGWPYVRTLAWTVGIIGTGMVAWPIFF